MVGCIRILHDLSSFFDFTHGKVHSFIYSTNIEYPVSGTALRTENVTAHRTEEKGLTETAAAPLRLQPSLQDPALPLVPHVVSCRCSLGRALFFCHSDGQGPHVLPSY